MRTRKIVAIILFLAFAFAFMAMTVSASTDVGRRGTCSACGSWEVITTTSGSRVIGRAYYPNGCPLKTSGHYHVTREYYTNGLCRSCGYRFEVVYKTSNTCE